MSLPAAYLIAAIFLPVFRNLPSAVDWPDIGAVIVEDVANLDYRTTLIGEKPKLVAILRHRQRIKVLNEHGLSQADIRLPIDGFSTVTRVRARSITPSGDDSDLDDAALRPVMRTNKRQRAPEIKLLSFTIPGVVVRD
ncbi:MAG: hypothetical protein R3C68_03475 [Myxococcota bacterium]